MHQHPTNANHRTALAATLAGLIALMCSGAGVAQVGQVVEIAQVAQVQMAQLSPIAEFVEGYDWSILIAAGFGIIGLYWIRRHISRL